MTCHAIIPLELRRRQTAEERVRELERQNDLLLAEVARQDREIVRLRERANSKQHAVSVLLGLNGGAR